MVLVEVEVPSLRKTYDFKLNTEEKIENIITEIVLVICQKEKEEVLTRSRDMMLTVLSKGIIMNNNYTLSDYSVVDGMKLLLV